MQDMEANRRFDSTDRAVCRCNRYTLISRIEHSPFGGLLYTGGHAPGATSVIGMLAVACVLVWTGAAPAYGQQTVAQQPADELIERIQEAAYELTESREQEAREIAAHIGDRTLALFGEASHGTSEYYQWRAELSRELITEYGYDFVVVEGDWPAFYDVNRYVKHRPGAAESAREVLAQFDRWPPWMWPNTEFKAFVEWLHDYNRDRAEGERVGLYGMDIYAMYEAMERVQDYMDRHDAELAGQTGELYGCLEQFEEPEDYIRYVARNRQNCQSEVERVVKLLDEQAGMLRGEDEEAFFNAYQNALMVKSAEEHYRANVLRGPRAWNARVAHFKQTAGRLLQHYGEQASGVVWAHNTHIGDARATEMEQTGQENIGQLVRERYGEQQVFALGFGAYTGSLVAGRQWEAPMEVMELPEAAENSVEHLFEQAGMPSFFLRFGERELDEALSDPLPHRAVGVAYRPEQESGNYVQTVMPERYDGFIFLRQTEALDPLDR